MDPTRTRSVTTQAHDPPIDSVTMAASGPADASPPPDHRAGDTSGHAPPAVATYVEDVALFFERSGMPRMSGRLLGALMVSEPPERSQEELATFLGVSRGSVSQASRMLVEAGLVERRRRRGGRRDYYRVRAGAWTDMIERRVDAIVALRRLAERGIEVVDDDGTHGHRALVGLVDVCRFFEDEWPGLVTRWRRERGDGQGPADRSARGERGSA
jgi:DNA-binding transcriptional ArsR family regulator